MSRLARKNPYDTRKGEPKTGQFAEWYEWEKERHIERWTKLTPEQQQAEKEAAYLLKERMKDESASIRFE